MKLFLTSSCINETLHKPFLDFLNKSPEKVKLYFIPTATDVEENKFYTCKSLDDFSAVSINPIWYSLKYKTKNQIARELSDADIIWVGGGNTFYLLHMLRKTGAMEVIDSLVRNNDVMFGGTSAGTIVATPSIEIAGWGDDADINDVHISNYHAFGFVSFFTQVHYEQRLHQEMLLSKKGSVPVYSIPDGSAIEVNNEKIIVHGTVAIFE